MGLGSFNFTDFVLLPVDAPRTGNPEILWVQLSGFTTFPTSRVLQLTILRITQLKNAGAVSNNVRNATGVHHHTDVGDTPFDGRRNSYLAGRTT